MADGWAMHALELAAAALALAFAAVVLAVGPRRRVNRQLALLFAVLGLEHLAWEPLGIPALDVALTLVTAPGLALLFVVYVLFLAENLDTPLVHPFRRRGPVVAVALVSLLSVVPFVLEVARQVRAGGLRDLTAVYETTNPVLVLSLLIFLYGFVASYSAFRRSPAGSAARARALYWAWGFGARDLFLTIGIVAVAFVDAGGSPIPPTVEILAFPLSSVVAVPVLAYGILKTQLFDIDLRLKRGVSRGTLVAVFLAVFLVVAYAVQELTSFALGIATGGLGVALLLFAIVPLHRFAERVADRLLPGVSDSKEYLDRRKLEVYRAAVEDTIAAGRPDLEGDEILAALRRSLGIRSEEHRVIVALAGRRAPSGSLASQFEVLGELGRGGSGRALLARDRALRRTVVLKQPLGILAPDDPWRELFLREARLAARIHHPNVVAVHQVLAEEDPPVLVLEHVDGESLADLLRRRGALPESEVARIALDVLAGLARIHREGIVHRDVKPANILLDREGVAKVTDFGVAHAPTEPSRSGVLTVTGFHPGSPAYMSPEQAAGKPLDARSDLYSVGLVLVEAATGRRPASAEATAQAFGAARGPAAPIPDRLAPVLARALAEAPEGRFPDAEAMAAALRSAVPPPSPP